MNERPDEMAFYGGGDDGDEDDGYERRYIKILKRL